MASATLTSVNNGSSYLAAIDQGTTSSRCIVFDGDGQVVAVVARKDFAAGLFDPLGDRGLPRAEVVVDACMVTVARAEQLPLAVNSGA